MLTKGARSSLTTDSHISAAILLHAEQDDLIDGRHESPADAPRMALGAGRGSRCVRVQALLKGGGTLGVVGCQH